MSEMACRTVCQATVGESTSVLRKSSSSLRLVYNEPIPWSVVLDNSEDDYGPAAAIANPRTYAGVLNLVYTSHDEVDSWESPDLIVEDYDYDTDQVSISGRCRLSQLDREDQTIDNGDEEGISTFEDTTVAAILSAIAADYGMTVTGAPTRAVKIFQAVGNPLNMFRELLEPTHVFRMGAGSEIVCESITSNTEGPVFVDDEHLEIVRFKRTSEIYNSATVERVVEHVGLIDLVNSEQTHDESNDLLSGQILLPFSEPSRAFTIDRKYAKRGVLDSIVFYDSEDDPINLSAYTQRAYVGLTPVHSVGFQYTLIPSPETYGPFTPEISVLIRGYGTATAPPEAEGYSQTATAGDGDRPYPEPYTSTTIETEADALAAATALVATGTRQGNILNFNTRLNPTLIPWPNNSLDLTDYLSGLTDDAWIVETVAITESEDSDPGTMAVEATRSEAA